MLALVAIATFAGTMLGGLFALKLRDSLHLILGFSAGAVIAVAFFDLLPESVELASQAFSVSTIFTFTAIGFLAYLVLDRAVLIHGHTHDHKEDSHRGSLGALALAMHSFLDGLGIGLAFQLSPSVGLIVAAAVIAHDFSDGVNTVNLVQKETRSRDKALQWLIVDALAPVVGILLSLFITVSEPVLGLTLATFSGFFLYLGASDLIPESHHAHPVRWTTISTVLGAAFLYLVIQIAG